MFKKIGIIGIGMVGGALKHYLENIKKIKPLLYDTGKNLGSLQEVNQAEVIFICVPTPFNKEKEYFDKSILEDVFSKIEGSKIVVIKSTILPGITDYFQEKYPQHKILHNPEFLTEATADQDMCYPDRQILGYTKESYNVAKDIMHILPLAPFERILPTKEAEMVKYFNNMWFAAKVTFANQIYNLCQKLELNYDQIMEVAAADKRIGRSHLEIWHKGKRGYAGRCLPKDVKAFLKFAEKQGIDFKLFKLIDEINDELLKSQSLKSQE